MKVSLFAPRTCIKVCAGFESGRRAEMGVSSATGAVGEVRRMGRVGVRVSVVRDLLGVSAPLG